MKKRSFGPSPLSEDIWAQFEVNMSRSNSTAQEKFQQTLEAASRSNNSHETTTSSTSLFEENILSRSLSMSSFHDANKLFQLSKRTYEHFNSPKIDLPLNNLLLRIGHAVFLSPESFGCLQYYARGKNVCLSPVETRNHLETTFNIILSREDIDLLIKKFDPYKTDLLDIGNVLSSAKSAFDKIESQELMKIEKKKQLKRLKSLQEQRKAEHEMLHMKTKEDNFIPPILATLSQLALPIILSKKKKKKFQLLATVQSPHDFEQVLRGLGSTLTHREYRILVSKYRIDNNFVDFDRFRKDFYQLGMEAKKVADIEEILHSTTSWVVESAASDALMMSDCHSSSSLGSDSLEGQLENSQDLIEINSTMSPAGYKAKSSKSSLNLLSPNTKKRIMTPILSLPALPPLMEDPDLMDFQQPLYLPPLG